MKNLILGYSPLTEKIYLGRLKKNKPNEWAGEKKDMTSNFISVLLQKFEPGTETEITVDGNPKYSIVVRAIAADTK